MYNALYWAKGKNTMQEKPYDTVAEAFWNNLTPQDKLKAFYAVTKRIHEGDLQDGGSYRYVLYNTFGFGPEAYSLGMESGYFDIHNSMCTPDDKEQSEPPKTDDLKSSEEDK